MPLHQGESTVGLDHDHGTLTIEAGEVVNREHGKNPLTRKEWDKETRVGCGDVAWVLVKSRDRSVFSFALLDAAGRVRFEVNGCRSKPALDAVLGDLAASSPSASIWLAHPSYGLTDPVHERAKKAQKQALDFNRDEEKRRERALGARPEIKVKRYNNHKDYQKDANKMARDGWMPEQQISDRGKVSLGGTAAKTLMTGGLGLITGMSHKSDKITVTWVKQPKGFIPRDFVEVPDVPAPRVFEPELYFAATLVAPVAAGQEFSVGPAIKNVEVLDLPASSEPIPLEAPSG